MKQYFIINEDNTYGGSISSVPEVNYTELEPKKSTDIWDGSKWVDNSVIEVPQQLSRMKFIIQVYITTGIKYEDIVLFIQNLAFDEAQKYVILTRLRSATHFDRNSSDLLIIAGMMGISQEQLDNIFINGNLIE